MTVTNLNFSMQPLDIDSIPESSDFEVNAMLMYEGEFEDSSGKSVKITKNLLNSLAKNYKEYLSAERPGGNLIKRLFNVAQEPPYKNVSLNHDKTDVEKIVGKVIDLYTVDDDLTYLFGKFRLTGEKVKEKVNKIWRDVSISFDRTNDFDARLVEVSYVFDPAIPAASSFSTKKVDDQINFAKIRTDLAAIELEKKKINKEIKFLKKKKETYIQVDLMVKDGLLSRSDFKRLCIDADSLPEKAFEPMLRIIRTVALSKKGTRTQLSNNFSSSALSSFIDNLEHNHGITFKKEGTQMTPNQAAEAMIESIKQNKPIDAFMSSFSKKEDMGDERKEDKKDKEKDNKHHYSVSKDDFKRMRDLAAKKDMKGLKSLMSEISGEDYKRELDEDEDEDESDEYAHKDKEESKEKEDKKDFSKILEGLDSKIEMLEKKIEASTNASDKLLQQITDLQIKASENK